MKNWYVLYVKSRHEFVAHNELTKKDVETFLPAVKRLRQWKDRKKCVDFPLFPGYLSAEPGHPTSVSPDEISSLQLLIESGRDIEGQGEKGASPGSGRNTGEKAPSLHVSD